MSIFGPEFEKMWPKAGQNALKLTNFGRNLLKNCQNIAKPDGGDINIKDFIQKSSNFPLEFGTNTCRVVSQPVERYPSIQQQIASAYPVIHERVLGLYLAFLEHKCQYGNKRELEIYPRLSLIDFVQRLLTKRCASFFGKNDKFLLITHERGVSGFMDIGTDAEKLPLLLQNVLSYDEIKLSALLSVSSHSEFINDGNRNNGGIIELNKSNIVPEGVVVGIIGGRFECPGVMESQDILITKAQNTTTNGYGVKANPTEDISKCNSKAQDYRRLWKQFYEEQDFLYDEVLNVDNERFSRISDESGENHSVFDNVVMKKRYAISFDTLLLESEARAAAVGRQAYVHVIGIGLGVWKAITHQKEIFLETFIQRLKALLPQLNHVGCVHFSWFHTTSCGDLKDGGFLASEAHPNGGICTYLSNRNPAQKLPVEHENMLLVVSFAWDGNALPGNEFWMKRLTDTGDSSTACSTLVSELLNVHINDKMVNGSNLHVATLQHGVMHIADYINQIMTTEVKNP